MPQLQSSFVFSIGRLTELVDWLTIAFNHPWVESYQIGYGPPLIRCTETLRNRLKETVGSLARLRAYVEEALLEPLVVQRLVAEHRKLCVRRFGQVETELIDETAPDVLDLRVCLKSEDAGFGSDNDPEIRTGQFLIRLDDIEGRRFEDAYRQLNLVPPEESMHLELRVLGAAADAWEGWVNRLAETTQCGFLRLNDPMARVPYQVVDSRPQNNHAE